MKIVQFTLIAFAAISVFSYCSSSKNTAKPVIPVASTYENNIQQLVVANCSPCHIPAKGGNKLALDNYEGVSKNIDNIISRIEKNPTDRGFMPFKREKLSDSAINVFKQWKQDGLLAK
jgi:nitrate/TMAO reductase-like tetraheme cytochrome c subunit